MHGGRHSLRLAQQSVLARLFQEDIHIANWGRKFAETEFLQTEEKFIPLLFTSAAERYEVLLKNNPELLQENPAGMPCYVFGDYSGEFEQN